MELWCEFEYDDHMILIALFGTHARYVVMWYGVEIHAVYFAEMPWKSLNLTYALIIWRHVVICSLWSQGAVTEYIPTPDFQQDGRIYA